MAGLLPNNVKAELIGTKIELLDKLLLNGQSIGSNTKIADSLTGNAKVPENI